MIRKYPRLKHLFSCYFHQDMDEGSEETLKEYVFTEDEGSDYILQVLKEIKELRTENYNSEQLWDIISNLGCEYRYQEYYNIPEKWLDYISDTIMKYLAEKESIERREKNGM